MNSGDILIAVLIVSIAACYIAKLITRSISISKQGWPPPHLDADGDAVECDCHATKPAEPA